jgi:hypothetical protein
VISLSAAHLEPLCLFRAEAEQLLHEKQKKE